MTVRTDLALEAQELEGNNLSGVSCTQRNECGMKITVMRVLNGSAARRLGKDEGTYITCEFKALTDEFTASDKRIEVIGELIRSLIPEKGCVLTAGIGNRSITADALGPLSASHVLATRHISGELARTLGLDGLRSVCVLSPGVLGQTGLEVRELISRIVKNSDISCVIAIDALASRRLSRLGCTVQISDTGISPGAGVGNHRAAINARTLGVPVISVGVPTVVDAATLVHDLTGNVSTNDPDSKAYPDMVVTPKEIDLLTERASVLIGMAINSALQPQLTTEELFALA